MFPRFTRSRIQRLPVPKHWLAAALILSALVIALGLTVQFAPGVTSAELTVDQEFSRHHIAVLTVVALGLNVLFSPVAGALLVLATSLYLLLIRRSAQKAVLFAITVSSGWLACQVFKVIVGRIRPDPALFLDPLVPEPVSNSFPSGHSALAVSLTLAAYFLARDTRWANPVLWAGLAVSLVVAWSRVYIGAHYPLDVLASFPATTAAVMIMAGLWNRHAPALAARLQTAFRSPRHQK